MSYRLSHTLKGDFAAEAAQALLRVAAEPKKNRLIFVRDNYFGRQLLDELSALLQLPIYQSLEEARRVPIYPILFPALEFSQFLDGIGDSSTIHERILARHLWEQRTKDSTSCSILILPIQVGFEKLEDFSGFSSRTLNLKLKQKISKIEFVHKLEWLGYSRVGRVLEVGQFSEQGRIIDVFSPLHGEALRVEIWNDEVSSIRCFDVSNQRTSFLIDQVDISANVERILPLEVDEFMEKMFLPLLRKTAQDRDFPSASFRLLEERLKNGAYFSGSEFFFNLIAGAQGSIFNLASEGSLVDVVDVEELEGELGNIERMLQRDLESAEKSGSLVPSFSQAYFSAAIVKEHLAKISNESKLIGDKSTLIEDPFLNIEALTKENVTIGSLDKLLKNIEVYRRDGFRILIFINSDSRRAIIEEGLLARGYEFRSVNENFWQLMSEVKVVPGIFISNLNLVKGFLVRKEKLLVLAESEIFGVKKVRPRRLPFKQSNFRVKINSLGQLGVGDIVVHEQYGIGKFQGLKKFKKGDYAGEYLDIEYGEGSKLYVPIQDFLKVGRYQSSEGGAPPLTVLGSGRWEASKQKIKVEIASLTGSLLKTHAARTLMEGFDFGEATEDEKLFADTFPFVETEDQSKAIADVLSDMSNSRPMDRLVCGDVGFGKTEIALRAAFKAVQAGKQVALLAPTTLLVDQHFKTFSNRFDAFPYRIGLINRFRSKSEVSQVLSDLETGAIDIIIGTHRLLQKDVQFKDIGLVIIDEEQKFGVAQKERLKRFRVEVDVLTLSATPIPRTLQQALHGTRELSIIETAPFGRRPIGTKVARLSKEILLEALDHELARGGQVYVVQHLISGLVEVLEMIKELRPDVKVEMAHGKMSGAQLEDVMRRFYSGEIRVLVSTAIVESGLDVSNANTLIVLGPEDFGLSQLYQLRGRVGRGEKRATAYFLYEDYSRLTDDAKRRLAVMDSQDTLGNGFRLALQDMELRGAGSLFGKDQSGHAQVVGYDMYFKILEEAVSIERNRRGLLVSEGEKLKYEAIEPDLALGVDLVISEDVVQDMQERLMLYQRALEIDTISRYENFKEEFIDRFGVCGEGTENFLLHMLIRNICIKMGIVKVVRMEDQMKVKFFEANRFFDKMKNSIELVKFLGPLQIGFNSASLRDFSRKLEMFC